MGGAIGALGGLLRGAAVLSGVRVQTPEQLMRFHARMSAWREPARVTGLVVQGTLIVVAAGALVV